MQIVRVHLIAEVADALPGRSEAFLAEKLRPDDRKLNPESDSRGTVLAA
jgi:hypothetical protein